MKLFVYLRHGKSLIQMWVAISHKSHLRLISKTTIIIKWSCFCWYLYIKLPCHKLWSTHFRGIVNYSQKSYPNWWIIIIHRNKSSKKVFEGYYFRTILFFIVILYNVFLLQISTKKTTTFFLRIFLFFFFLHREQRYYRSVGYWPMVQ